MELYVPGRPVGKGRPRFGKGRTWTPTATVTAENEIRSVWREAGSPTLEGPISLSVTFEVTRPKAHYTSKGDLSMTGQRMVYPYRQKPDLDNAVKLVADSLNGLAWRDDVEIVWLFAGRAWAEVPGTRIKATEL